MSSAKASQYAVKYTTHREFRSKLKHIQTYNSQARIIGLDVGRKYTGLSISDRDMKSARGFKTVQIDDGQNDFYGFCQYLRNTIRGKHVKGIVVGYPLNAEGTATRHCVFIQDFLEQIAAQKVFRSLPITLVNEYNSSMMAKVQIVKMLQTGGRGN